MTRQTSTVSSASPIIVYGQDKDLYLAGYFKSEYAIIAAKAAESLKLKVAKVDGKKLGEIAGLLKPGRPYERGKSLVTTVSKELFGRLIAAIDGTNAHAGKSAIEAQPLLPSTWAEIRAESLVIAQESAKDGWWEAIVVAVDADMLTLRWRDYPKYPQFSRHRYSLALLRPNDPDQTKTI
jgi:hypothetical protein